MGVHIAAFFPLLFVEILRRRAAASRVRAQAGSNAAAPVPRERNQASAAAHVSGELYGATASASVTLGGQSSSSPSANGTIFTTIWITFLVQALVLGAAALFAYAISHYGTPVAAASLGRHVSFDLVYVSATLSFVLVVLCSCLHPEPFEPA